ncbi:MULTISPECIES: polysaccharide deacetylase family protein [unclassified Streptomyces]|uniref:polysaccharide deacetylase family protein n=1 Tax=unclassified Streptomyces TaxID=2593676 RepID=UPI0019011FD4|nr:MULTISPECIES: polysaccharide deacetylase family protein [unclassified Streptomyces]MBK0386407.1 polysaccharide deacetylase family protein [Streptomyces sp. RB110-2]
MWIAALAWDLRGYEVVCVNTDGGRSRPAVRFGAGAQRDLIEFLKNLDSGEGGDEVLALVESTNGLLDGPLMAAGIGVCRVDPWLLPERPGAGSVSAADLARHGLPVLSKTVRLTTEVGTLAGRIDELVVKIEASAEVEAELTRRGLCIERGSAAAPRVALTFDDGPHPLYTPRVLDILREYGVPATFFCVGLHADAHADTLASVAAAGHSIGNHTWSHPFLPDLTQEELYFQIDATNRAVERVTGTAPHLLRPPYGSRSPDILGWLADRGMTTVLWDNDPCDWASPGTESIVRTAVEQTANGSIVLLHDGNGDRSQTVEALPGIIEQLLATENKFVTVDEITASL